MSSEIFSASASTSATVSEHVPRNFSVVGEEPTDCGHGVSRDEQRECGRIHDPQTLHPENPRLGVDNGVRVVRPSHLTCTGGVKDGVEAPLDEVPDLIVGADVGFAGEIFVPDEEISHGLRFPNLSGAFEGREGDFLVRRMGEPVGIDDGVIGGVVGCDVNGSS